MKSQLKTVLIANLILKHFNLFTLKLNNFSAANAKDMIVMPLPARSLKEIPMPLSYRFLNNVAFKQQWNCAINGIAGNSKTFFLKPLVKTIGIKMFFKF